MLLINTNRVVKKSNWHLMKLSLSHQIQEPSYIIGLLLRRVLKSLDPMVTTLKTKLSISKDAIFLRKKNLNKPAVKGVLREFQWVIIVLKSE